MIIKKKARPSFFLIMLMHLPILERGGFGFFLEDSREVALARKTQIYRDGGKGFIRISKQVNLSMMMGLVSKEEWINMEGNACWMYIMI